jgi:hypothetical protein
MYALNHWQLLPWWISRGHVLPWWVSLGLASVLLLPALWWLGGWNPNERTLLRGAVARFVSRRRTQAAPPADAPRSKADACT